MSRMPYGLADARQHPIVAALHDFVCHRTSIWLERPFDVGHERCVVSTMVPSQAWNGA